MAGLHTNWTRDAGPLLVYRAMTTERRLSNVTPRFSRTMAAIMEVVIGAIRLIAVRINTPEMVIDCATWELKTNLRHEMLCRSPNHSNARKIIAKRRMSKDTMMTSYIHHPTLLGRRPLSCLLSSFTSSRRMSANVFGMVSPL